MYEVIIRTKGMERVVKSGIRRENGARNERDIAADSAYRNGMKHAEGDKYAHVVRGSDAADPNAEVIVYFDDLGQVVTTVTYRKVGRTVPEPTMDLENALLASLVALTAGTL